MATPRLVYLALARHGCTPNTGVQQQKLALAAAEAFQKRRFNLRHEPIIHINTGRVLYNETLCSLRTENKPLRIDHALKALEKWGASLEVNLFLLNEALAERRHRPSLGRIGINLPPNLLNQASMRRRLSTLLNRYRINGRLSHVVIELVETHPLTMSSGVLNWLRNLRKAGARIALDDYAAPKGCHTPTHAALSVVDIIKLDGALTEKLLAGKVPAWWPPFVQQIKFANKQLVAEHATTVTQAKLLQGMGVGYVQSRCLTPAMFKR